MRLTSWLLLKACLIWSASITAQQYPFIHYTPKEGLVNSHARSIFQDSKGRLYICTFGGLSVYDGVRFINYTTDHGLVSSMVNEIIELGEDSLLLIANANRLQKLVKGRISDISLADNFCPVINQLLKAGNGKYYAIADEGIFLYADNRFKKIVIGKSARGEWKAMTRAIEANNRLFIITDISVPEFPGGGILLIYDLTSKKLLVKDNEKHYFISKSPEGEIFVATANGLKKIDKNALQENKIKCIPLIYRNVNLTGLKANYIYFDRQNNLWLSTDKGILRIDTAGSRTFFSIKNGLLTNFNTAIFQDREDVMWFTNDQYGLTKFVDQQLELYSSFEGEFRATDISTTLHSDSIWLADINKRKIRLIHQDITKEFSIPSNEAFNIIGGNKVYVYTRDDFYSVPITKVGQPLQMNHLLTDSTGISSISAITDRYENLIFTSENLTIVGKNQIIKKELGYLADQVVIADNNFIWTVTRARKLFRFKYDPSGSDVGLELLNTYENELPPGSPRSITIDTTGKIWIGTRDHGLYQLSFDNQKLNSWKKFTMKDGLSDNFINYLHCDADNNIWACSPAGLDKIEMKNGKFVVRNYNITNHYKYVNKIQTDKNGVHWVLTRSGILKIPAEINSASGYRPKVVFSGLYIGNERLHPEQNQSFPHTLNTIAFHVAAPSFVDENQTHFSYLLEGSGLKDWSPPSRTSEINFVNLPKGDYTLHVKAIFQNGLYPDQFGSFSFVILPAWWETWIFKLAVSIILIVLTLALFRMYLNIRLRKQKLTMEKLAAVEKERNRIATDIHDDLGAGVTRIKFLTEMLADKKGLPEEERNILKRIMNSANELVEKMGEIIWAMNEQQNSIEEMIFYLRSYAVDYCNENNLKCNFEIPDPIPPTLISGHTRRNVFLVLKECLHNIVKHAKASEVSIRFTIQEFLTMGVSDNGIGLNTNKKTSGNGLLNMYKRAASMNGRLELDPSHGTHIRLQVPLLS